LRIKPASKHKNKHFSAYKSGEMKMTLSNQICSLIYGQLGLKKFPGAETPGPHSTRDAVMRQEGEAASWQGLGKGRGGEGRGKERRELPAIFRRDRCPCAPQLMQ
jgi:hypothetical protein